MRICRELHAELTEGIVELPVSRREAFPDVPLPLFDRFLRLWFFLKLAPWCALLRLGGDLSCWSWFRLL